MSVGRSLELFFIDGQPDGLLTAEVFNWAGHVLQVPRARLKAALERQEAKHTGVYILLGENQAGRLAYIGESENIGVRLREHAGAKSWWETAVLITTSANSLNKAHVKYLEARLVELAREAQQTSLENGTTPALNSLSEAAASNMESFLETLLIVLPAIRIDMFINSKRDLEMVHEKWPSTSPEVFKIVSPKLGINATALVLDGELIVQAGSLVRDTWVGKGSWDSGYRALRDQLIESSVITSEGGTTKFAKSFAFSSPSAAAAVVQGRASNGRVDWLRKDTNDTYSDWENEILLTRNDIA